MPANSFLTGLRSAIQKIVPSERPDDPNEPVTVVTLQPAMEAQAEVMRGVLEAEGIPCFIVRERTYYVDPIQLRVRRRDVELAESILKEMEEG